MARTSGPILRPAAAVLLLGAAVSCAADAITGPARVIDGDSLRIRDLEIRLHGIDAPEALQTCRFAGRDWACGETAARALKHLVGAGDIRCSWTERDEYGRALATCYRDGQDLNALMVWHGMALAYRRYSDAYVALEDRARADGRGVWDTEFLAPWDWREAERASAGAAARDCPVKGNVNRNGDRIYHVEGMPAYAKLRLRAHEGDRCFETVEAAEAAGFRPAGRRRGGAR